LYYSLKIIYFTL